MWKLKNSDINYDFKWSLCKDHPCTSGSRKYDLCLTDKLPVIKGDPNSLLNKHDELISKRRHLDKFSLSFFKE